MTSAMKTRCPLAELNPDPYYQFSDTGEALLERIFDAEFLARRASTDNEREQLRIYMEAFFIFREREAKYHSLWQQYGAIDSCHHMKSKVARCEQALETTLYFPGGTAVPVELRSHFDEGDPIDLINYTAFLIRNMRAGRIHSQSEQTAVAVESWRVVDKWWTDDPVTREYRTIELNDGSKITQFSEDEGPWTVFADG
jgi:hypothetical protein